MGTQSVKVGATMYMALGFAKRASLTEYGRKRSEGQARALGRYSDDLKKTREAHGARVLDRIEEKGSKHLSRRKAWSSELKGLGNLKRLNPIGGMGGGGAEALRRVRSKAASSVEREAGVFGARTRFFDSMGKTHKRLNKEHPVQGVVRDIGAQSANERGAEVVARVANRRAAGKKGGRWGAVFTASRDDLKEFRARDKKAAEVEGGFEQQTGNLGSGEALGDGLRSMMRPYDASESAQVAIDQGSYRRFHGHSGDGVGGRR